MHVDERCAILKSPDTKNYACQFLEKRVFQIEPGHYPTRSDEIAQYPVIATLDQPQSFARIVDRSGKIWVGTIGYGVRVIEPVLSAFQLHFPNIIFCNPSPMPEGKIWAGMFEPDKMLDLKTGQISAPVWTGALAKTEKVNAALYDEANSKVFLVIQNQQQQIKLAVYNLVENNLRTIQYLELHTEDPVMLLKDSKGALWLAGTGGEVLRFNIQSQTTEHWRLSYLFPKKVDRGEQMARCIVEDKKGRIWIGSEAGLLCIIRSASGTDFKSFHNENPNGPIFRSPWIFSICPHAENPDLLWLATMSGGLALFDSKNVKVRYLDQDSRLHLVISMVPDAENNLWLATNHGIFQYQPAIGTFVNYAHLKHIPKISLNAAAAFKNPNGGLVFGGTGLLTIKPEKIKPKPVASNLIITDIKINRTFCSAGSSGGKIRLNDQKEISLNLTYQDRFIAIYFSVPAGPSPDAELYRYRLIGLEEEWNFPGQKRSVELAGLAPGNYSLEIEAIAPGEAWSEARRAKIPIHISAPWYAGTLAWFFYTWVLIALIWVRFRNQRRRLLLQFKADISQKEVERLQAMDDFKNRFFAYIAHEFKTPLTIIMGAGEHLRRLYDQDSSKKYTETILHEGNNMLSLIHELIDVTRLQDKSIQLRYEHLDVVAFLQKTVGTWTSIAEASHINLKLKSHLPVLSMGLDPIRTQYILNNLLANAIKYTPPGGTISIELEQKDPNTACISIADTGSGIAPDDLPHIFEKYFRGDTKEPEPYHFGLGLSFVKDLTELLGGTIAVESTLDAGTTFRLVLPIKAPANMPASIPTTPPVFSEGELPPTQTTKAGQDAPLLLLVDDNPTIQSYLKQVLQPHFNLIVAKNGKEGLDMAIQDIPDIILTDVMMPVMDGIAMTHQIKTHQLTNHIPVVMLSAKNEIQYRIEGQEQGADAYLGKPFNDRELILTLHNLNRLQQLWKHRYASVAAGESNLEKAGEMPDTFTQTVVSSNDAFMQSILDAFEINYPSENFDAIELAAMLNISKAQLYRKISKISDEGVMELLRNYRLQKAVGFLEKYPDMSTKEVAFNVGFKEYSHFSASFKKRFGVAPSEWRKSRVGK